MVVNPEVELLRHVPPRFADRCVDCGRERPGDSTTVYSSVDLESFDLWPPRRWFRVTMPTCAECRSRMEGWRWFRRIGRGLFVLLLLGFTVSMMPRDIDVPLDKLALKIGLALIFVPWMIWDFFFYPPVSVCAGKVRVRYFFLNAEIAREFAALNHVTHDVQLDLLVDDGVREPRDDC